MSTTSTTSYNDAGLFKRTNAWFITQNKDVDVALFFAAKAQLELAHEKDHIQFCALSLECAPTTGHKHLHCLLASKTRPRPTTIRTWLPFTVDANFQPKTQRATWLCSLNYVKYADYDKTTQSGTLQNEYFFELGTLPEDPDALKRKGSRSGTQATEERYSDVISMAKKSGGTQEIETAYPSMYLRFFKTIDHIQKASYIPPERVGLMNFWIYGDSGCGKTSFVRNYCKRNKLPLYVKIAENKWWDFYDGEQAVLLDDCGSDSFKFADLWKTWTDYAPFPAEVKGGTLKGIRPQVFFFTSNLRMQQVFTNVETHLRPLQRRIQQYTIGKDPLGRAILIRDEDDDPFVESSKQRSTPPIFSEENDKILNIPPLNELDAATQEFVDEINQDSDLDPESWGSILDLEGGSQDTELVQINHNSETRELSQNHTPDRPHNPSPDHPLNSMSTQKIINLLSDDEDEPEVVTTRHGNLTILSADQVRRQMEKRIVDICKSTPRGDWSDGDLTSRMRHLDEKGCVAAHFDSDVDTDDEFEDDAAQGKDPERTEVTHMVLIRKELDMSSQNFKKVFLRIYMDGFEFEFVEYHDAEPSFLQVGDAISGSVYPYDTDGDNLVYVIPNFLPGDIITDLNIRYFNETYKIHVHKNPPSGLYMIDPAWRLFPNKKQSKRIKITSESDSDVKERYGDGAGNF